MPKYTILHTEWSSSWGGQEIRILTECRLAKADGHRVILGSRPGAPIAERARAMGLETLEIPMRGQFDPGSIWRVRRFIKSEGVDILHTHASVDSWIGAYVSLISKVAFIRTRHCGSIRVHPLNWVYRAPRATITTGEAIRAELLAGYHLAPERVISIPTGIDTQRFSPGEPDPELAQELGIAPGAPVVGMVAVLRSWKRHDLFCEMAKALHQRLPQARFLIVGGGPGWERINGYLDQMGLREFVTMTGHREDVGRLLRLCQVLVLPSGSQEGTSQSVIQALACERGMVASDPAKGDVVMHEKTGLVTPYEDVPALADAVQRLLEDHDLRRRLGRAGRELVLERYSDQGMHQRIMRVYEKFAPLAG